MRRDTISSGLKLLIGGVASVVLATFYHGGVARFLSLSSPEETQFIFIGLFAGGVLGFSGILLTIFGFLRAPLAGRSARLLPLLSILLAVVCIFFLLFLFSAGGDEQPRLRPEETITI